MTLLNALDVPLHETVTRPATGSGPRTWPETSKEVLHAIATFQADISPAFPYVNAELGGWDYDQANQVLLLKLSDGKWITLHPQKIAIRGIRDLEEARALLVWIQAQINDIYARRDNHHPALT